MDNTTIVWIVVGLVGLAIVAAIIYAVTRNKDDDQRGRTLEHGAREGTGPQRRSQSTTRVETDQRPGTTGAGHLEPDEDDVQRAARKEDEPGQRRRGRRGGDSRT